MPHLVDRRRIACSPVRPLRVAAALLGLLLGVAGLLAQADKPAPIAKPQYNTPVLIRFEGPITSSNQGYIYRKIDQAKGLGADLLIVEITSPGGLLEESLQIARRLSKIDWAHTVAYVPREAISGGAIMALGCDDIVMDDDAQIGDAGAIYADQLFFFRYADAKTRTYLTGHVRALAEAKGRPPLLAEAMVDKEMVLYRVRDKQNGEEKLMSEAQIEKADDPGRWEKIEAIDESTGNRYLQLSGRRAVELGLAQFTAGNLQAVERHYQLAGPPRVLEWGAVDTTVMVLNHWLTSVLLIVVGLVAIYVELASPGIGVGGLTAGLCFAIFFWSHFMGGTSGWLEVILFLAGIVFLGMEIFVIPGWGVAGVTGILLMISSLVLASQSFIIPSSGYQTTSLVYGFGSVMGAITVFVVIAMVLSKHLGSLPVFNRLILKPPSAYENEDEQLAGDDEVENKQGKHHGGGPVLPQVGEYGVADSPLRPAGKVRIGEEYIDVVTEGVFVDAGSRVRVVKVNGNQITVREVRDEA